MNRNSNPPSELPPRHQDADKLQRSRDPECDAIVITALVEEHRAVVRAFAGSDAKDATSPFRTSIGDLSIVLECVTSPGNITASLAAQQAIQRWHPTTVVLCGIAAGVRNDKERQLGDVIVADQVAYYELEKKTGEDFRPRYRVFPANSLLVHAAKLLRSSEWVHSIIAHRPDGTAGRVLPVSHAGTVACGEKVVADERFVESLRRAWPQLIGLEMEGAGVATACHIAENVRFILIKGICDWADAKKSDDWHAYAADAAACFTKALLARVTSVEGVYSPSIIVHSETSISSPAVGGDDGPADNSLADTVLSRRWPDTTFADIFLEFLNPESRRIYGLFDNLPREEHAQLLKGSMNAAVFLCGETCILPAGSVAECRILQSLLNGWSPFILAGLLRLPIRERSLAEFFDKRQATYEQEREHYPLLFDPNNPARRQLRLHSSALLSRATRVGERIADLFEQGPDSLQLWVPIKRSTPSLAIAALSATPRRLLQQGRAVTWPAVQGALSAAKVQPPSGTQALLQRTYCDIYASEFGLRYLTSVPFARFPIVGDPPDLCYDYRALEIALRTLLIWEPFIAATPSGLVNLRLTHGYFTFRRCFDAVARRAKSVRDIGESFSAIARTLDGGYRKPPDLQRLHEATSNDGGDISDDEMIATVAERLDHAALRGMELLAEGGLEK
jgi:nucleoside phosphorylase